MNLFTDHGDAGYKMDAHGNGGGSKSAHGDAGGTSLKEHGKGI